ncbi:MAG: DUF2237 domain-containing protein [Candidatus Kapaibacterium sp.]|nr:MAG: DUF2237 domain-containing protein [Candidatus Kapabacteria bacterium]
MTVRIGLHARNVLGETLQPCSLAPLTGYYRTGCCDTGEDDRGSHTVCAEMTEEFLAFSKSRGNDLSTPVPQYNFPGLKAGDRWCLCAGRWREAWEAGCAPRVFLASTHVETLRFVPLHALKQYAVEDV